ncbi:MAG: hypothetical protein P4M05_02900 [Bradyrhizobium sp.]|nr:hypothetical protein [Bradyrhizobium sp.]
MAKLAVKFLITAFVLRHQRRRTNRYRAIAIFSTLITIALIVLYISQRDMIR